MRRRMLIYSALLALFLLAFAVGYVSQQTKLLEQELKSLQIEIEILEAENAHLRVRLQELRLLQEIVLERMEKWLDTWEVEMWEATAYAPLDSRAVEGMCYSGDPRITASGVEVVPGVTAAASPGVPFGTRVYIPGFGFRVVQDRGGQIGPGQIDVAVGTQDEALAWGRRAVKVVYMKNGHSN